MARYTVRKGKRYRAIITLGFFQGLATNEMVAGKFREAGFSEVEVTGSGRRRLGHGLWPHDDAAAKIPDEIDEIFEIEV